MDKAPGSLKSRPKRCPHCKGPGDQMYFESYAEGSSWTCLACGAVVHIEGRRKRKWIPRRRGPGAQARSGGVPL